MSSHRVVLDAFPAARREHVERVIHKHNRGLNHHEVEALAARVGEGTASVVARYGEAHAAHNVVQELAYHGARAHVAGEESA
jgi:hypothetical protein